MKTRYIPENAEAREFPAAAVVAYCYESQRGPALIAYKGRQSKPARFYAFQSVEARDKALADYVAERTREEDAKRERRNTPHGLQAGDIVYCSWGYEQTNVTFYEVVRVVSARSAAVREIEAEKVESGGSMSGKATPRPGVFAPKSVEVTRRATGWERLGAGKEWRGELAKWDGKPCHYSTYG